MSTCIDRLGASPVEVSTPEPAPDRGADRRDDDATTASAFAGMLAVAITPHHHAAPQPKAAENPSGTGNVAGAEDKDTVMSGAEHDLARLAPELRTPLERVLKRMQSELGHRVTVVEATGDQARQKALFAQGRPALGSLMTWTKHSGRLDGLPASVMTDSQHGQADVYQLLARIAREEGLAALGPLDAEHAGAPATTGTAHVQVIASSGTGTGTGTGTQAATVAAVAQIAHVAQVAAVATVVQVAAPVVGGAPAVAATAGTDGTLPPATGEPATGVKSANGAGAATRAVSPDARSALGSAMSADANTADADTDKRKTDAPTPGRHDGDTHRPGPTGMPVASSALPPASGALRQVGPLGGVDVAERIARVLQLQASTTSGPLSHVVLRLDGGGGGSDLIRIGIRANSVDATLALRDPTAAGRAQAQIGELQQALGRRGLASESLQVQLLAPEALKAAGLGGQVVMPSTPGATLHQRQPRQAPNGHTPPRDQRGRNDPQSSRQHPRRSPNKGS